jgi:nucleotide-binding universal stress UspA family protein
MVVAGTRLRRILVATDFSAPAGSAVARAARLARAHGATLTALHVLPEALGSGFAEHVDDRLRTHVAEFAEGTEVGISVRRGPVAPEVAAEVAERGTDLVVVGAHGGDWLADLFLGSTAENVVRTVPVPVLLVRKPATSGYRTVILAVDTTSASADAARFGVALAPDAEHILVHACTIVGDNLMRIYGATEEQIQQLGRTSTALAREKIANLSEALAQPPVRVIITDGHPPSRLVELCAAEGADLVVTGTGSRSAASYALLGSVAQHVLRQAPADVLVVPAREG